MDVSRRDVLCQAAIAAVLAQDLATALYASALENFEKHQYGLETDEVDMWTKRMERAFKSAIQRAECEAVNADANLEKYDMSQTDVSGVPGLDLLSSDLASASASMTRLCIPADIAFLRGMSQHFQLLTHRDASASSTSVLSFCPTKLLEDASQVLSKRLEEQVIAGDVGNVEALLWFRNFEEFDDPMSSVSSVPSMATSMSSMVERHGMCFGANPCYNNDVAIRAAAAGGHTAIVRILLADGRADPQSGLNIALRGAVLKGFVDIVRALLADGRADPTSFESFALRCAVLLGHADMVCALLADGRADLNASSPTHLCNTSLFKTCRISDEFMDACRRIGENNAVRIALVKLLPGSTQTQADDLAVLKLLLEDKRTTQVQSHLRHDTCVNMVMSTENVALIRMLAIDGRFPFFENILSVPRARRPLFRSFLEQTKMEKYMSDSFYDPWTWPDS